MTDVPVKIQQDGSWITTKVNLQENRILISDPISREIQLKVIDDLDEKKNVLSIHLKGDNQEPLKVASVPKVLRVLKRLILLQCSGYRLMAYFMSPAIRGGVLIKDAKWEKGAIAVLKSGIWFISQEKQVCIPLKDISDIEQTKREVNGKSSEVVKIDHVESGEVVSNFILCPPTTLQVLFNFLKDTTKDIDMDGHELDQISAQVAMLVYSGMDSHAIENMLKISNEKLEQVYDSLLGVGIVEVVKVRREVQLTTKGVRFVTDAAKSSGNR